MYFLPAWRDSVVKDGADRGVHGAEEKVDVRGATHLLFKMGSYCFKLPHDMSHDVKYFMNMLGDNRDRAIFEEFFAIVGSLMFEPGRPLMSGTYWDMCCPAMSCVSCPMRFGKMVSL